MAVCAACLATPTVARALEIHGFASQGYMRSVGNNHGGRTKQGTFELTEVGVSHLAELDDKMQGGFQFATRVFGKRGDHTVGLDWGYLSYRLADWLRLSVGLIKAPAGLYNEAADIDAARTSVILPLGIYDPALRQLAYKGAGLRGDLGLGVGGDVSYHLYVGKAAPPDLAFVTIAAKYASGGRLIWQSPLPGLRLAASGQYIRYSGSAELNTKLVEEIGRSGPMPQVYWDMVNLQIPYSYSCVASAEYAGNDLVLAGEYHRMYTRSKKPIPVFVGDDPLEVTMDAYYAMATYRLTRWLEVGGYYAVLQLDDNVELTVDMPQGNRQTDAVLSARFDVNEFWLIKVEGHRVMGTAGIILADPHLSVDDLQEASLLFLLKTTLTF